MAFATRNLATWIYPSLPHSTGQTLTSSLPSKVTSDYAPFQLWDTSQGLCSYVRGMLCQKAIMVGIGVGQEVRWLSFARPDLAEKPVSQLHIVPTPGRHTDRGAVPLLHAGFHRDAGRDCVCLLPGRGAGQPCQAVAAFCRLHQQRR